jgi:dethiobiotin synthetase
MLGSARPTNKNGAGVVIVGTQAGCGKTVLACGLAGALREQGFNPRVLKPVFIGTRKAAEQEISFISTAGKSPPSYPMIFLERPANATDSNWQNAVAMTVGPNQLNLIEMPGGCATPVCYESTGVQSGAWRDSADLAREFDLPCILVAKHQRDALESLVLGASYLKSQGLEVLALATVEVVQSGGAELENHTARDDFSMGLFSRTNVPFMGCMKFSPSISVPSVTQGSLIKTTAGLDLLILLRALNLGVPTA